MIRMKRDYITSLSIYRARIWRTSGEVAVLRLIHLGTAQFSERSEVVSDWIGNVYGI